MPLRVLDNVRQSASVTLGSDITTTSATFATILTLSPVTRGGLLMIRANSCHSNSSATVAVNTFRIQVNGTTVAVAGHSHDGGALSASNEPMTCGLRARVTGLTAGTQTVTLQWATNAGTARINASTGTNGESAYLSLFEVLV